MDGISELTAAGHLWKVGGKEYRLSPLSFRDRGEIERYVASIRPSSLATLTPHLGNLPESLQKYAVGLTIQQADRVAWVSRWDAEDWLSTTTGHIFRFWLMLRHSHPDLTLDDVTELIYQADDAETQRLAKELDGMPSGNSSGLTPANGSQANHSPSTGEAYSAT